MRSYKIWIGLFVLALCWGVITPTKADSPVDEKDYSKPEPVRANEVVLNPNTASITQLTLITPTVAVSSTRYFSKIGTPGDLPHPVRLGPASGDINGAVVYFIGIENFEELVFPQPGWTLIDNTGTGQHFWGDVPCFPLEGAFEGFWSGWPASRGTDGRDPCNGDLYPPNLDTWLRFGPFSLADAQYADVQFFYRIVSEPGFDLLSWYTSTNGTTFSLVNQVSGVHIGPLNNGYNEVIFDLVSRLGQPNVWIAFRFQSDGSNEFDGPFLDGINILVEEIGTTKIFLPTIIKSLPPITQLSIKNNTPGNVAFTVHNTPQGSINCNISTGQTKFCGQFTPGTYNATSNAAACPPPTTKSKTFNTGPVTLTVVCK